jgi:hypothetical protein
MADLRGFLNRDIFSSWVSMMTIDFISGGFKLRGVEGVKSKRHHPQLADINMTVYGLLRTDQHD